MRIVMLICSAILLSGCAIREVGTYYPLASFTVPAHPGHPLPKDIFVTIDGTGYSQNDRSNAARLYEWVDSRAGLRSDRETLTFYSEGVGSGDFNPVGLLTGGGMGSDIKLAYEFLARNWQPGDAIYLNGFSRGAYGVRALGGMLYSAGIPDLSRVPSRQRRRIVNDLFDAYKTSPRSDEGLFQHLDRRASRIEAVWLEHGLRDLAMGAQHIQEREPAYRGPSSKVTIRAMTMWDTVAALGAPDHAEDPLEGPDHYLLTTCNVEHAFQALSLDDNRSDSFTPVFVSGPKMQRNCPDGAVSMKLETDLHEVWFAGSHSDVGGTYIHEGMIDGALHNVSLAWMIERLSNVSGALLPAHAAAPDSRLSIVHDAQAGGPFRRMFRKPLAYRSHVYGTSGGPVQLHRSVLDRLEYVFALDQWTSRCPGPQSDPGTSPPQAPAGMEDSAGPPLLCARELVSSGLVPELYAVGCLRPTRWGYRLTPGQEEGCANVVGTGRTWDEGALPLPPCPPTADQQYLTGTYYTGDLDALEERHVLIPVPGCAFDPPPSS